jgi:hypothetical protein
MVRRAGAAWSVNLSIGGNTNKRKERSGTFGEEATRKVRFFYWVSKRVAVVLFRTCSCNSSNSKLKTKEVDILSPDAGSLVVLSLVALHFRRSQSEANFRETGMIRVWRSRREPPFGLHSCSERELC